MVAWLVGSAAAAWILVVVIVAASATSNFFSNAFWGLILIGIGVYTIGLHLADAPQPNILLVLYAGVTAPTRMLFSH